MPKPLGRLPELLFAGAIGVATHASDHAERIALLVCDRLPQLDPAHALIGVAVAAFGWAYAWMETGHGTAYTMARVPEIANTIDPKTGKPRKQTLSWVVDPLCKAIGAPLGGVFYSWVFMGLKGLLIGLPLFPLGLALAILWPLAYEIGWQATERSAKIRDKMAPTEIGEYVTGAFTGLIIGLSPLI